MLIGLNEEQLKKYFELSDKSSTMICEAQIPNGTNYVEGTVIERYEKSIAPQVELCRFLEELDHPSVIVHYLSLGWCIVSAKRLDLLSHVLFCLNSHYLNSVQREEYDNLTKCYFNN